jgi:UDP-N-acetylmuramate: L-alanyl-gamma-D-glutamyl-meso-diaminopimelate ligase
MGGLALLARAQGHTVSGSDASVYPPMSDLLREQGIEITEGYDAANVGEATDLFVVGNALSRGNPEVETILDRGLRYSSGAQWLAENVLANRWTIAVAGTHGKTTTSSMVAWILEYSGLAPGFLIGGVPINFGISARLGDEPFFVVEADEYDTAFFDKRSKFVHYRPRTAVLNNLEFDHADIFDDLEAIQTQFHHLVRTVPASGQLIVNADDLALSEVLDRGCWSQCEYFGGEGQWQGNPLTDDYRVFEVRYEGQVQGQVSWQLIGEHNMHNALAAIAAARHAGVAPADSIAALGEFKNARRRLEIRYNAKGVTVYDDFAHHPTEIAATLSALRQAVGQSRIVAVVEPRSNTMRMGVHRSELGAALSEADQVEIFRPEGMGWDLDKITGTGTITVNDDISSMVNRLATGIQKGDHIVIMSNGGFGGLHEKLIARLKNGQGTASVN